MPVGKFAHPAGPDMASAATSVNISIEGHGGHAARPHKCIDPVLVGAQLIDRAAVDRLAQRRSAGIGGDFDLRVSCRRARNVIPQTAELEGTVRTLNAEVRELVEKRMREVVDGVAQ